MKSFFSSKNLTLQQKVMRRVWYSYLLSLVVSRETLRGFVIGASAMALVELVSVSSIFHNLLAVRLGDVPIYVWQVFAHAFSQGEFLTLAAVGLLVFSLLSFGRPKWSHRLLDRSEQMQTA